MNASRRNFLCAVSATAILAAANPVGLLVPNRGFAPSKNYFVDGVFGLNSNSGLTPCDAFKTIQCAIGVINAGDGLNLSDNETVTINVAPGTYRLEQDELVPTKARNVAIIGNPSDPEQCVIKSRRVWKIS